MVWRKDSGRRCALPLLLSAACLGPAASLAQGADPVAHCRAVSRSDAARIACLEAAVAALMEHGRYVAAAPEAQVAGTPDAPAAKTEAEPAQTAAAPANDLGAEQVAARSREGPGPEPRERLSAAITAIDYTLTGRPVFTLENGQVWRGLQPDPKYGRFTLRRHKTVEIWDSVIGGYRLKVDGVKRVVQVERLR